jgi:hypothetical protein
MIGYDNNRTLHGDPFQTFHLNSSKEKSQRQLEKVSGKAVKLEMHG